MSDDERKIVEVPNKAATGRIKKPKTPKANGASPLNNATANDQDLVNANDAVTYAISRLEKKAEKEALSSFKEFDQKFFVIRDYLGACRIGYFEASLNERTSRTTLTLKIKHKSDFFDAYADKLDDKDKSIAKVWFSKTKKRFSSVVYKDPRSVKPDELNLYHGFSVEPKEGDITPWKEFVCEISCGGDAELAEYCYNLEAFGVQNPFEPWLVYVICYSKGEGTGKDTFVDMYGDLFMDYYTLNDASRIIGKFNDQIAYKPVVKLAESGVLARDAPKLRGVITSPRLDIEGKGLKGGNVENIIKFFMTTNIEDAVRVSLTDRRTLALEFSQKHIGKKEYWDKLYNWYYKEGGINKVLYFFQQRKLGEFKPYPRPITELLRRMQDRSLPDEKKAMLEMLEHGYFHVVRTLGTGKDQIKVRELNTREFRSRFKEKYPRINQISDNTITDLFKEIGCTKVRRSYGVVWRFPALKEARDKWDSGQISKHEWDDTVDWWDVDDKTKENQTNKTEEPKSSEPMDNI